MARRNINNKQVQQQDVPIIRFTLAEGAHAPTKATAESACFDLYAFGNYDIYSHLIGVSPLIHTGVFVDIPKGYHIEVYLRSGVSHKTCLRLANGTGIIDSDYKGEIMLIVDNIGRGCYPVRDGDRLAQCMLVKNQPTKWELVDELNVESTHGGLGSTGR